MAAKKKDPTPADLGPVDGLAGLSREDLAAMGYEPAMDSADPRLGIEPDLSLETMLLPGAGIVGKGLRSSLAGAGDLAGGLASKEAVKVVGKKASSRVVEGVRPYVVEGGKKGKTFVAGSSEGAFKAAAKEGIKATGAMPANRADVGAWVAGLFNRIPSAKMGTVGKGLNLAGYLTAAFGVEELLRRNLTPNAKDIERSELQKEGFQKALVGESGANDALYGGGQQQLGIKGLYEAGGKEQGRRDQLDLGRVLSENGDILQHAKQGGGGPSMIELYNALMADRSGL